MNFQNFRETGDLSDITVVCDGLEFKLHRFPLFAKSEYFCAISRKDRAVDRVDLVDFPGGSGAFSIAADFCYNMKIDLTKHNIVELRCAADFLKMAGEGNLAAVCDKFLVDCLTTAKLSKSVDLISTLMLHCADVGKRADDTGILDLCIQALVDCWLKPPTMFFAPSKGHGSRPEENRKCEENCPQVICSLPCLWFCRLLSACRKQEVDTGRRCRLACAYIDEAFKTKPNFEPKNDTGEHDGRADLDLVRGTKIEEKTEDQAADKKIDDLVHCVLGALGDDVRLSNQVSAAWISEVLRHTSDNCLSRQHLLTTAVEVVRKGPASELAYVTPSLMKTIMDQMCKASESSERSEFSGSSYEFIDSYMKLLADRGDLTPEQFCKLSLIKANQARQDHDGLFGVMQTLLEKAGDKKPTAEEATAMMDVINFNLLTETALEKALARDLLPPAVIAKTALSLCARLREEIITLKSNRDTTPTEKPQKHLSGTRAVGEDYRLEPISSTRPNPRTYIDTHANLRPHAYQWSSSTHHRPYKTLLSTCVASQPLINRRTLGCYQADDSFELEDELTSQQYDESKGHVDRYPKLRRSFRDYSYYGRP